jgi:hypothetical protein
MPKSQTCFPLANVVGSPGKELYSPTGVFVIMQDCKVNNMDEAIKIFFPPTHTLSGIRGKSVFQNRTQPIRFHLNEKLNFQSKNTF